MVTLRPSDVKMLVNTPVSAWMSLSTLLNDDIAVLYDDKGAIDPTDDQKQLLNNEDLALSLRFELTFPPMQQHQPQLAIRAIPKPLSAAQSLEAVIDLASMKVANIGLTAVHPGDICRDDGTRYNAYPTVFTTKPINMQEYHQIIDKPVENFLKLLVYHHDHSHSSWLKAVKTRKSNNSACFKPSVRANNRPRLRPVHNPSGIYRISKFGANFDLSLYVQTIPPCLSDVVSYAYATSTWSSYRTGWKTYLDYLQRRGVPLELPCPPDNIVGFICYCFRIKALAPSTVNNYTSGLKAWQSLLNLPDSNFDTPYIKLIMRGFKNLHLTKLKPPIQRSVITWPILQILAKEIEKLNCSDLDKQCLWSVALLAFWGSMRMGELLQGSLGFDKIRTLSWSRIQSEDNDHAIIFLALPKTATRQNGQIVDIFSFPLPELCPIHNLNRLAEMNLARRGIKASQPVFALSSGNVLTMKKMNETLKNTLDICFPNIGHFTCHSFRAGLPSIMGAFPQYFTESMLRDQGRWFSDSVNAYTKIKAIGYKKVHNKLVSLLLDNRL